MNNIADIIKEYGHHNRWKGVEAMQYIDIARNPKIKRIMKIILLKNHARNQKRTAVTAAVR